MMLKVLAMIIAMFSLTCQSSEKGVTPGPVAVVKKSPPTMTNGISAHKSSANKVTPAAVLRQLERAFAARFRHEILWNNSSQGFHLPKDRRAQLTFFQTSSSVWYCSRVLGTCARYRLEKGQLGARSDSIRCEDEDEKRAVLKFVEETVTTGHDQGLRGLDYSTGTFGSITLTFDSREEIVKYYRRLRPAKLKSLKDWIQHRADEYRENGYRSITIASFDTLDPNVYLYGDREAAHGGPLVFTVFWFDNLKDWQFEGMLTQEQAPEIFAQQKSLTQEIACETIRFK